MAKRYPPTINRRKEKGQKEEIKNKETKNNYSVEIALYPIIGTQYGGIMANFSSGGESWAKRISSTIGTALTDGSYWD